MRQSLFALPLLAFLFPVESWAEIVGDWHQKSGERVSVRPCGDAFCIKLTNGNYAGVQVGKMRGAGNSYAGTVTDPSTDHTYQGSATVKGSTIIVRGCVLKLFCKSQTWHRD